MTQEPEPRSAPSVVVSGPEAKAAAGAVVVQEKLPETMLVFPLRRAVPFPNLMMPVLLDTPRAREIAQKAEAQKGYLLLLAQKEPGKEELAVEDFHATGVIARVLKTLNLPDGNASAMCQGLRRARLTKLLRKKPYLVGRVSVLVDMPPTDKKRAEALFRSLQQTLKRVVELSGGGYGEDFSTAVLNIDQPAELCDFTGSYFLKQTEQRQRVLDAVDVQQRLEIALELVMQELEFAQLGARIQEEIRQKAEKAQKEYFLREQMKIIRRELGEETDARVAEISRLEKAIDKAQLPEQARKKASEDLTRLKMTPVESPEYGLLRNALDWLSALPWAVSTKDNADLGAAAKVLEQDHYGLEDVKQRILEFLAVRKLASRHQGSILCFSGPPGVGKTSLGRSIARAMGRKFWRFSLGGMRDEAEIKGHRRTYIGAMPGRILQGLKTCGSNNPVILLDEIDKLGADFRGDPASALLEVLDPEQNNAFLDHYLDVPFDLSRVMFLATANVLPSIPEALRDRMEVIEIPGYLLAEKVEIARRHLVRKQIERHGLDSRQLTFTVGALRAIVQLYTREAGVRALEKAIVKICRKAAFAVASRKPAPGRVQERDLDHLLGKPKFAGEGERRVRVAGVAQGLAWTPHGGDVLFIEAMRMPGKGVFTLTGQLGEVMNESGRIALSYVRGRAAAFGIRPEDFEKFDMHVHFPAGAIPKDGPSAGIAIACALVSMHTGKLFPSDLAMTGELTLVGEVLPIGGVREKVLAAKREGIARVILPAENRRDLDELEKDQVRGIRFEFVETFDEVFRLVFGRRRASARRR